MQNTLLALVKIATALTVIGCALLTVWSLLTAQPLLLTVVGFILTVGFGYFSYTDIKKMLNQ